MFNEGNILNFLLHVDTLKDIVLSEKWDQMNTLYHVAIKKIPEYDEYYDKTVKPVENNGYKLELFIHNFLNFIDPSKFALLRVSWDEEFSPVKNAEGTGKDSPEIAWMMLLKLHKDWLWSAGVEVEDFIEISGLDCYEGENLKWKKKAK